MRPRKGNPKYGGRLGVASSPRQTWWCGQHKKNPESSNFLDQLFSSSSPKALDHTVRAAPSRSAPMDSLLTTSDDTNHVHDNEISTCDRRRLYVHNQARGKPTPPPPVVLKKKLLGSQGTKIRSRKYRRGFKFTLYNVTFTLNLMKRTEQKIFVFFLLKWLLRRSERGAPRRL